MKIILASKSPRRKQILEDAGHEVIVSVSNAPEEELVKTTIQDLVIKNAVIKAQAVAQIQNSMPIISADTVVYFNGEVIGQQKTEKEAIHTLNKLLGKTHEVWSGICVLSNGKLDVGSVLSKVTLKNVSDKILNDYVKSGLYKRKAGAYNIGDPEFISFVEKVEGSKTNILGLPIEKVNEMLLNIR